MTEEVKNIANTEETVEDTENYYDELDTLEIEDGSTQKDESANGNISTVSSARVDHFGEVYTPPHIVKDMFDLVNEQLKASGDNLVTTTFLEPACGHGNFLVHILEQKLAVVNSDQTLTEDTIGIEYFKAVASTYGVDIQCDNVYNSKRRMSHVVSKMWEKRFNGAEVPAALQKALHYVMDCNIIWGNTLTNERYDFVFCGDYRKTAKQLRTDLPAVIATVNGGTDIIIAALSYCEWIYNGETVTRKDFMVVFDNKEYAEVYSPDEYTSEYIKVSKQHRQFAVKNGFNCKGFDSYEKANHTMSNGTECYWLEVGASISELPETYSSKLFKWAWCSGAAEPEIEH